MKLYAVALAGVVLCPAAGAFACTLDQVNVIDFHPETGSNGDGSGATVRVVGQLDSFCGSASDVYLRILALDANNNPLSPGAAVKVTDVPAGGKQFDVSAPDAYRPDAASYQVSVVEVLEASGAGPVENLPGSTNYTTHPANVQPGTRLLGNIAARHF